MIFAHAAMAELVDALDSGSSRGNSVDVRVILAANISHSCSGNGSNRGCIEKFKPLEFSQIWPPVLEARVKKIAPALSSIEWLKKWRTKDG